MNRSVSSSSPQSESVADSDTVDGALGVFRKYISPIDGDRCPMYPSCSHYSHDAAKKHGLIMGWIMTCDRLMRCGRDELRVSPPVVVGGALKCFDPVENNDFWWSE
ncbi:MAG: membrane protein insertion efficiency factor YidD [Thermodesulfobacteriota bacterium]|nr:membrane protein insertion efficiency factor YidD [Thermodesulfobacteriota bacterium]